MNVFLLAAVLALGLLMIPFGMPGTWIIAAAALGHDPHDAAGGRELDGVRDEIRQRPDDGVGIGL